MSKIRILNTEKLSDKAALLEKVLYNYIDKNGGELSTSAEVYHRKKCTSALLYDPVRKTILLAEQIRIPTYLAGNKSGKLLEVCAGVMDEGESPEECIIREIEEELGYRIPEVKLAAEAWLSPAALTEYMYFFVGKYTPDMRVSSETGKKSEGEDIRVVESTFGEMKRMLRSGKIRDSKTILLLQHALLSRLIS